MAQVQKIPIKNITPNPKNARKTFQRGTLNSLAESIRKHGVIFPIIITPNGSPTRFTIVAGERRWRAAKIAGLSSIPALVRANLDTRTMLEIQLIENLQRDPLDYLEEARAYEDLKNEFGLTDLEIGQIVGKSRSTVSNARRLLNLPAEVAQAAKRENLSMRNARRLVTISKNVPSADLAKAATDIANVSRTNAAAADRIIADLVEPKQADSEDARWESVSMLKYAFGKPPAIDPDLWQSMERCACKVCNDCGINTMAVCKDCPATLMLKRLF